MSNHRLARDLVRRAVKALYEEDAEFVEGGCAGVARLVAKIVPEARVVVGYADGVPHAWLNVRGEVVDPITLGGGPQYHEYEPDTTAAILLDDSTYGWTVKRLRGLLKGRFA